MTTKDYLIVALISFGMIVLTNKVSVLRRIAQ